MNNKKQRTQFMQDTKEFILLCGGSEQDQENYLGRIIDELER